MNRRRWPFWLWTSVILLVVLPWTTLQNHTHWGSVAWIPFFSPPLTISDILVNVVLYAPWGHFLTRMPRAPRRIWVVGLLAAGLSLSTETAQLYSHGRFPSATDVTCNIVGALIGAGYARRKSSMTYV